MQRQSVVAELPFGRRSVASKRYFQPHSSSKRSRSHTTGSKGAASGPCPAARSVPHPLPVANTSQRRRCAYARAAVWLAATHSSVRLAIAAQQSGAGIIGRTGTHSAAARRCGRSHRPTGQFARGARQHRGARADVGAQHRCEYQRRAARPAACRGNAWRQADESRRSMSRASSSSPCRARNGHLPRAGAPHRSRTNSISSCAFLLCAAAQGKTACGRDVDIRTRMHQRLQGAGHEAVIDEDILLKAERLMASGVRGRRHGSP
jgi:hypothetical protein